MIKFISNSDHYTEVLARAASVKETLWIGTADIKDLYVGDGRDKKPFIGVKADLVKRGVGVRMIHAKEPEANNELSFGNCPGRDKFPKFLNGAIKSMPTITRS